MIILGPSFWNRQETHVLRYRQGLPSRYAFPPCVEGQWPLWCTGRVKLNLILQTVSTSLSPIAINRLLTYLGGGGKGAIVRPRLGFSFCS